MMTVNTHKGTALITGASAGIGAVYADRLAKAGYDLILVARNAERLRAIADRLTTGSGRSIDIIAADLTDAVCLARVESVLKSDVGITLLVNNAGVGATAPLLNSDIVKMERMIMLNVSVPTRLAYAVAPAFVSRGVGTIINISSGVALAPEILNGVYGASKAFLLAFSRSLHHELSGKGVRIQVVLPGAIATEFWDIAGTPVDQLPQSIVMSAEDMVDAALAGLEQRELVTIPSLPDKADWDAFEDARSTLTPQLSWAVPAERYGIGQPRS